jgi:hypothetical protein
MSSFSSDEQFNQLLKRLMNNDVESVLASVRADKSLLIRRDEDDNTILHYSVENTDLCRELLDLGADVNAVNNKNKSVLYIAIGGCCVGNYTLSETAFFNYLYHNFISSLRLYTYLSVCTKKHTI